MAASAEELTRSGSVAFCFVCLFVCCCYFVLFFKTGTPSVDQAGLEPIEIHLPLPLEYWALKVYATTAWNVFGLVYVLGVCVSIANWKRKTQPTAGDTIPRQVVLGCIRKLVKTGGGGTHTFNPSTGGKSRQIFEFETSLAYRLSSRTARATQRKSWKIKRES
ncbi:hypothetical protein ACRRTK_009804 [Alexandromys fortis]